jgi:acetyl esterase
VLSVGYRLAPETRFPGQLEDARAACAWALQNTARFGAAPNQIAVGGDSAGGYLAATCAVEINARTPGAVALQVLLYPLVHIEEGLWAEEELRNFRFIGRLAATFIGRSLGTESFPSLLELALSHAPPTIVAGGGAMDPVRADVKLLCEALRGAGVRVTERKYPTLMHGGLNATALPGPAVAALKEVGALMRLELAR